MAEEVLSGDDESIKSKNEDSEDVEDGGEGMEGNPGLADALAKVIRMSKNKKRGKSIVLSKAKLYRPDRLAEKKGYDFEIEPDPNGTVKLEKDEEKSENQIEDVKPNKRELKKMALKKQERIRRGRLKPTPLDRVKEKPLVKIATKGVVQLFNAVRQQQSAINRQINKPGVTESKKEKVLKSIDKNAFLDVLRGRSIGNVNSNGLESNELNDRTKEEPADEGPAWEVLRDDFMMGAKLKDWDKKEIEIEE